MVAVSDIVKAREGVFTAELATFPLNTLLNATPAVPPVFSTTKSPLTGSVVPIPTFPPSGFNNKALTVLPESVFCDD